MYVVASRLMYMKAVVLGQMSSNTTAFGQMYSMAPKSIGTANEGFMYWSEQQSRVLEPSREQSYPLVSPR